MRLRGPCRVAIRTEGADWVSRLAARGACRSLQERLPDAAIDLLPTREPWDLEVELSGNADDPLALLAGYGVPDQVLRKRREMAEIVGWLPPGKSRPVILTTIGLDERWVETFAGVPATRTYSVLCVDGNGQRDDTAALPEWASDADRSAACSAADLMAVSPGRFGAAAFARGPVIFCGPVDEFPAWTPRELIAGTPRELAVLIEQFLSGGLPTCPHGADLEDRLDELATLASATAFARSPESYRRWAAEKADLADATSAELESVRDRRRGDRAILGETAHRLAYAEEQYGHCDYARLQAEEELSRLRRSRSVRVAERLARLMRA